jgi:hypothetical protein
MIRFAVLVLGALFLTETIAQNATRSGETHGLTPGEHAVGFHPIEARDDSRAVTGGVASAPHPVRVRTYLWYPAESR